MNRRQRRAHAKIARELYADYPAHTARMMLATYDMRRDEIHPWGRKSYDAFVGSFNAPAVHHELPALAASILDARALIRESRGFHQSTAGPPRPGTNENGPELEGSRGRYSCSPKHTSPSVTTRTANLPASLKVANVDFSTAGKTAPETDAVSAVRDLEQEGLADADISKTRH